MGKLLDDGLEVLAGAKDDPLARYAIRKMRPYAERALDEVKGYVGRTIDRFKAQLRDEPEPRRRRKVRPSRAEVIDADIVDQEGD